MMSRTRQPPIRSLAVPRFVARFVAAAPVVAYDVPGPTEMICCDWLVPVGAANDMAAKVVRFLKEPRLLGLARAEAQARSRDFDWPRIARQTLDVYLEHLKSHRARVKS
jgi:glycosyltransferase involved in cell wall biosynthesis